MDDNECFQTPREYFPHEMNFKPAPYPIIIKHEQFSGDNNGSLDYGEPTRDISHNSNSFLWNRNVYQNRGEPLDRGLLYKNNHLINTVSNCGEDIKIKEISIKYEDYKALQDQFKAKCVALQEIQKQKMLLNEENQKLVLELANEKKKASHINKKIKYIQENQNLLLRLKEEYKTIRDDQLTKRHSQTDNKEIQTVNNENDEFSEENTIIVKESDLDALQDTVQLLKQKIMEKLWTNNTDQLKVFQDQLNDLLKENQLVKENLSLKKEENEKLESDVKQKLNVIEKIRKDKNVLKKIILKLEKRQRDFVKKYEIKDKEICKVISDSERSIVQHIIKRYIINKTCGNNRKVKQGTSKSTSKESSSIHSNYITSSGGEKDTET